VIQKSGTTDPFQRNAQPLDLGNVDLRGADLIDAHLERANLTDAHLEGANLTVAHLDGAQLRGADLRGRISGAPTCERRFSPRCGLEGAVLYDAHLEKARLALAHLEKALLVGAHLEGTLFRGLVIEDGFHPEADARGLTHEQLARASCDQSTVLPSYLQVRCLTGGAVERLRRHGCADPPASGLTDPCS
jgi:uncharacterized protein YjbI with pentapeptide repeats